MAGKSIDNVVKEASSIYKLVVIAAKRAKALSQGAPKFVETDLRKVTSIALEEIRQGKILWEGEEPPAAKTRASRVKKRVAKSKSKRA